jgi:hypothetical protein
MMKFLTMALGGLTMLTVTGLATAPGQAMFGMRQTQAQVPVSPIADPGPVTLAAPVSAPAAPASVPAPVAHPAVAPAVPAAAPVVSHPVAHPVVSHAVAPRPSLRPAAVARPVAASPVARPAPAAVPGANPMSGLGGAGAITNILLNLPQVLQGGAQGVPGGPPVVNNGGWMPGPVGPQPAPRGRGYYNWKHGEGHDNGDEGH